jgi:heme iron utilization protein
MSSDQKTQSLIVARQLLGRARTATLSVMDFEWGGPFGALVNVATDAAGNPLLLISSLARHTQCLAHDQRASVMVCEDLPQEGDALMHLRLTLTGILQPDERPATRTAYLARHPYAALYAGFGDFGFWSMRMEKAYVVAGFGRIYSCDAATFLSVV